MNDEEMGHDASDSARLCNSREIRYDHQMTIDGFTNLVEARRDDVVLCCHNQVRGRELMPFLPNGVWPVVLTPFRDDQSIDWDTFGPLIDWHVRSGAAGLFVCAGSSEVLTLTADEQIAIVSAALDRVAGRIPVIAGGVLVNRIEKQIAFIRRVAATGVSCVVLSTSVVVQNGAPDEDWKRCVARILDEADGVALGTYEMPEPHHRLLSPAMMAWLSGTGRFVFHKDTSCDADAIGAKLSAVRGSPLRCFCNADAITLPASLTAGGHGYSGIGANFFPELYVWFCRHHADQPDKAARVHAFLVEFNPLIHAKYMTSAKAFLAMRGLGIRPVCRAVEHRLDHVDQRALRGMLEGFHALCSKTGITPCAF